MHLFVCSSLTYNSLLYIWSAHFTSSVFSLYRMPVLRGSYSVYGVPNTSPLRSKGLAAYL